MNRRFLVAAPIAAAVLGAAVACGPSQNSADSVPSIFTPSALATSTQVKAAESNGQQILLNCRPKGDTNSAWEVEFAFHPETTTTALENCENIPQAKRQALATCIVNAVKAAAAGSGSKADKEAAFVTQAARCVQTAQGVAPSASASPSPSATASK
jgi:hypothetical protein